VAHVKAQVVVNPVLLEQAVLAEHRARVVADQRVRLSQQVPDVAPCRPVRSIVPVGVVVRNIGCHSHFSGNDEIHRLMGLSK